MCNVGSAPSAPARPAPRWRSRRAPSTTPGRARYPDSHPVSGIETASPTASPDEVQDIDSVSRFAGTRCSTIAIPAISAGATASPATNNPAPSSVQAVQERERVTPPPAQRWRSRTAAATMPAAAGRRRSVRRAAIRASRAPASLRRRHHDRPAGRSRRWPPPAIRRRQRGRRTPRQPRRFRAAGSRRGPPTWPADGTVPARLTSAGSGKTPTVRKTAAVISAAEGNSCSASTVANGGPRMKTASSISDSQAKAVRSGGSGQQVRPPGTDQRADPGAGASAIAARTRIGHVSWVNTPTTIIAASAGRWTAICQGTMRR